MDAEVPPPERKVEDDFWSDSDDDEAEAEAWAEFQRECLKRRECLKKKEEVEIEEVELGESSIWMYGVEEEDVIETSEEDDIEELEEDEFLGLDIGSLGDYEGVDVLYSDIDIDYFDALLEDELEEIVEPTLVEEPKCGDLYEEVVEDEEHHCRPEEDVEEELSPAEKPQEKA
ncbi:MAG: hypothetical protein Q8755_02955, partial [Candidatus Phytoplasma australasiaticum]|nr:hypothetical protein [Candidatus Phytoplasma australasiaticum]